MAHLGHWRQLTPRERFHRFAPFVPCDSVTTLYIPDNTSYDLVASTPSGNHGLRAIPHQFETCPEWEPDVLTTISGMRELCKTGAKVIEIPSGHRALLQYGRGIVTHMIKGGADVDIYGRGPQHVNLYGFAEENWSHPQLALDFQDPEHHGYISECLIERAVEGCGRRRAQGLSRLVELAKGEGGLGGLGQRQGKQLPAATAKNQQLIKRTNPGGPNILPPASYAAPTSAPTSNGIAQAFPVARQITREFPFFLSPSALHDERALTTPRAASTATLSPNLEVAVPPPRVEHKAVASIAPSLSTSLRQTSPTASAATNSKASSAPSTPLAAPSMARSPVMNAPIVAATTQHLSPSQRRRIRKLAARAAAELGSSRGTSPSSTSCRVSNIMEPNGATNTTTHLSPLEANSVQELTSSKAPVALETPAPSGGAASGSSPRTFASVLSTTKELKLLNALSTATRKRKSTPPQGNTAVAMGNESGENSRARQETQRSKSKSRSPVQEKQGPKPSLPKTNSQPSPAKEPTPPPKAIVPVVLSTLPPKATVLVAQPGPPSRVPQLLPIAASTNGTQSNPQVSSSRAHQASVTVVTPAPTATPIRAPRSPPRSLPVEERPARARELGGFPPRVYQEHYWMNGYQDRDYHGGNGYERRGGDYGHDRSNQGRASRFDQGGPSHDGAYSRYVSEYPTVFMSPQTYTYYSGVNYDDYRPARPTQTQLTAPRYFEPSPSRAPIAVPQIASKGPILRQDGTPGSGNQAANALAGNGTATSKGFSRAVSPPPTSRHSLRPTAADFIPPSTKPTTMPAPSTDPRRRIGTILTAPLPASLPARPNLAPQLATPHINTEPRAAAPTPIFVANTNQLVVGSSRIKIEEGQIVESKLDGDGWEVVQGKGKNAKRDGGLGNVASTSTATSTALTRPALRRGSPFQQTLSAIGAKSIDDEWTTDMDIDPIGERVLHMAESWELTKSRRQSKVDERAHKTKRHRSSQEFYKWLRSEELRLWEEFKREHGPLRIGGIHKKEGARGSKGI